MENFFVLTIKVGRQSSHESQPRKLFALTMMRYETMNFVNVTSCFQHGESERSLQNCSAEILSFYLVDFFTILSLIHS